MSKNADDMANRLQQDKTRRKLLQKNKRRVRDLTKRGYTVDTAWV